MSMVHESARRRAGASLQLRLFVLLACVLAGACSRVDAPQTGLYRAVLELPGGELPFGLDIRQSNNGYELFLINATERTPVGDVRVEAGELHAVFPGSPSTLRAAIHRDRLDGEVTFVDRSGAREVILFRAEHGDDFRFFERSSTDNADVSGHWQISTTNAGAHGEATVKLDQSHDQIVGTIRTRAGEEQLLAGQVHGDTVMLSAFDGERAELYKARVNGHGGLEGDYWSGNTVHSRWTATRIDPNALPNEPEAAM